jgi:hypothetical protein
LIGDRVPDVGEGVGETLEPTTVIMDEEIALLQVVEALKGIHDALRRVVEEEAAHGLPHREGGGAAMEHHVADRLGDGEVNPRDNAVVDL